MEERVANEVQQFLDQLEEEIRIDQEAPEPSEPEGLPHEHQELFKKVKKALEDAKIGIPPLDKDALNRKVRQATNDMKYLNKTLRELIHRDRQIVQVTQQLPREQTALRQCPLSPEL